MLRGTLTGIFSSWHPNLRKMVPQDPEIMQGCECSLGILVKLRRHVFAESVE